MLELNWKSNGENHKLTTDEEVFLFDDKNKTSYLKSDKGVSKVNHATGQVELFIINKSGKLIKTFETVIEQAGDNNE